MRRDGGVVAALTRTGLMMQRQGRINDALVAFAKAVSLDPDRAGLYVNLGSALNDAGRNGEAIPILMRGIQLDPNMAALHNNLGFALRRLGRIEESAAAFRRTVKLAPTDPIPRLNLGNALTLLCRFDEAIAEQRRAITLRPSIGRPGGSLLYTMSYHPTMPAIEIANEFRAWGRRMCAERPFLPSQLPHGRRLRVGYVSPDFRNHTTRFFLLPLLANLERDKFELFAYSNVGRPDAHTEQMIPLFDHWREIAAVSDEKATAIIRADKLDLLIDITGHMEANRLGIFARRAAPVQATWLGSCWTTGLPTMDFAIHDHYTAPAGSDALFTERVWRLPNSLFCFHPDELAPVTPSPAARNGYITFGYSGRSERLNSRVFEAWGAILARNPTAHLALDFACFGDPATAAYFGRLLREAGVDPARVSMRCSPGASAALAEIDILLDSFPHSGGTMLFDAVWAGVPIVTLAARPPVGRIGTGIMSNLDMTDWIAEDTESYVAIATEKGARLDDLAVVRRILRQHTETSPLGRADLFAHNMGQAYLEMVASMSDAAATMANERPE